MPLKVFGFQLDIKASINKSILEVVQNDIGGNVLYIRLLDDGKPYSLIGATQITFTALKEDNTISVSNMTIENVADGKVSITLSDQCVAYPGVVRCTVDIYTGAVRVTSAQFCYDVRKDLAEGADPSSSSEYPVLIGLIEDVSDLQAGYEAAMVWEPYSAVKSYNINNKVVYSGSSYMALVDGLVGVTPGTDPTKWRLLVSKGDPGIQGVKGDQGIQGIQGIQGVKGDKGDQGIQGIPGLDGNGAGDMLKSVYDPNDDGVVSAAATAPGSGVSIVDAGNYFTGTSAETALQEAGASIKVLKDEVINSKVNATVPLSTAAPVASIDAKVNGGVNFEFDAPPLMINSHVNGNMTSISGWTTTVGALTAANNILKSIGNGSAVYNYVLSNTPFGVKAGSKYYAMASAKVSDTVCARLGLRLFQTADVVLNTPTQNQWYKITDLKTMAATETKNYPIEVNAYYVDAATQNGKSLEVKEVMLVDLTAMFGAGKEPTKEWCDANIKFVNGIQPMMGLNIKAEGKNLFDVNKFLMATPLCSIYNDAGTDCLKFIGDSIINVKYSFKPNTQYTFKYTAKDDDKYAAIYIAYTDNSFTALSVDSTTYVTRTVVSDAGKSIAYLTLSYGTSGGVTLYKLEDFQIEEGVTATTYEPHIERELLSEAEFAGIGTYLDHVSYRNGVLRVSREIKNKVLQASEIEQLVTNQINYDYIMVSKSKFINTPEWLAGVNNLAKVAGYWQCDETYADVIARVGSFMVYGSYFYIFFAKGTYANLEAAQAALAGTVVWYALANPVTEIIDTPINGLSVMKGKATLSLRTGIVFEDAKPKIASSNDYYGINALDSWGVFGTGGQLSKKANKILAIYKDGVIDNEWQISTTNAYGKERAAIPIAKYDTKAHYKAKYEALPEEYNSQQVEFTAQITENLVDSYNETVKTVGNIQAELGDLWTSLLPLADKELSMAAVALLTTETSADLKAKINEILNIWR